MTLKLSIKFCLTNQSSAGASVNIVPDSNHSYKSTNMFVFLSDMMDNISVERSQLSTGLCKTLGSAKGQGGRENEIEIDRENWRALESWAVDGQHCVPPPGSLKMTNAPECKQQFFSNTYSCRWQMTILKKMRHVCKYSAWARLAISKWRDENE